MRLFQFKTRSTKNNPSQSPFAPLSKQHELEHLTAIKLVTLKKRYPATYNILLTNKVTHISEVPVTAQPDMLNMGIMGRNGYTHPVVQCALNDVRSRPDGYMARLMARYERQKVYRALRPHSEMALSGEAEAADARRSQRASLLPPVQSDVIFRLGAIKYRGGMAR